MSQKVVFRSGVKAGPGNGGGDDDDRPPVGNE